jgi:hypothetical protein
VRHQEARRQQQQTQRDHQRVVHGPIPLAVVARPPQPQTPHQLGERDVLLTDLDDCGLDAFRGVDPKQLRAARGNLDGDLDVTRLRPAASSSSICASSLANHRSSRRPARGATAIDPRPGRRSIEPLGERVAQRDRRVFGQREYALAGTG